MKKYLFLIPAILFPALAFAFTTITINTTNSTVSVTGLPYGGTASGYIFHNGTSLNNGTNNQPYAAGDTSFTFSELGLPTVTDYGSYFVVVTFGRGAHFFDGSCGVGQSFTTCWNAVSTDGTADRNGYGTFTLSAPAPPAPPATAFLTVPSSTGRATLGKITAQIGDLGFLKLIVIAMSIPLLFVLANEIIKLNDFVKKHPEKRR